MNEPLSHEGGRPQEPGALDYLRYRQLDWLPSGGLRWWLLSLIVLGWAVEQYEAFKTGPVLVYVLDEFDKTLTDWGYVAALTALVYGGGALLLSRMADRLGRRPLMIWPVACYALLSAAGAMAPSFSFLAATAMLGTFMMAGMNPAVHAASRDLTPRMGRAMVYAWVSLAFTLGALLSTLIAAKTLPIWPAWRPQFWIGSGLGLFTAAALFVFYRDLSTRVRGQVLERHAPTDGAAPQAADEADAYSDGRRIYRSPRLWILSGTIVFWSLAYVTVSVYVPTFLTQHYGMQPASAAGITSWFWILFTASVFTSGWLSDRLRVRKTITALGGISTGACFIAGAHLPLDASYFALSLTWSATGFFAGFIYPAWCALYSETAEAISPHGVGRAFGITATLAPLSGLTLHLGFPRVVASYGWPTWMTFAGCCCFCVALLVAFGYGSWWPERATRPRAQLD